MAKSKLTYSTTSAPLFYTRANDYVYDQTSGLVLPDGSQDIYIPLDIDTEFQTHKIYNSSNSINKSVCTNLTTQVKGIFQPDGFIYAHPDISKFARHAIFQHGFAGLDYLESMGYQVSMSRLKGWDIITDLPFAQFDVYAFFLLAELFRIFHFDYPFIYDIEHLCTSTNEYRGQITQQRRTRSHHRVHGKYYNFIVMPWILQLNGFYYRVRFSLWDCGAVHGVASYKDFCNNTGIVLKYKDNFSEKEKSEMLTMYTERPEDFDTYAKGDLYNHQALMANREKFKEIYKLLGLTEHFTDPRLTIGATTARIVESAINNLFSAEPGERAYINGFCKRGSADWLKRDKLTYAAYNLKVDGGRCRNNRPTDTTVYGAIADIDIDGCYGNGLRVQSYPLGIPVTIGGGLDDKTYRRPTLRKFLKDNGSELVPGLWQARVSLKPGYRLKYVQDYLVSWLPPKDLSNLPSDSDIESTDEWWNIDNVGTVKIFTREIHHAIITHDFIQWLEFIAGEKQKKELLDNLLIDTAMWYPASEKTNSIEELISEHQTHDGESSTTVRRTRKKTTKIMVDQECHKWYGVNLGDLLVNKLLIERAKYEKGTPMNTLIKLIINTIYGIMVSPFFTTGNVVVGNNITARARGMAWLMEKGFHGWESITDGNAFDLNRVILPQKDRRLTGENTVGTYKNKKESNHSFKPLGGEKIKTITLKVLDKNGKETLACGLSKINNSECVPSDYKRNTEWIKSSKKWIDEKAMEHLRNVFPNLDVLHQINYNINGKEQIGQYNLETKAIYNRASFHGSANYCLSVDDVHTIAMRSYSKRKHMAVCLEENEIKIITTEKTPGIDFLKSLHNPEHVQRGNVFLKEKILKIGDYRHNHETIWDKGSVYPGCTVEIASLLREFSLTQFTFQTLEQYKSWEREQRRLIKNYGHSYEMFFLNEDGTLNFQKMIETIDTKIDTGCKNFFDGMSKRETNSYRSYSDHPAFETYKKVQSDLRKLYCGDYSDEDTNEQAPEFAPDDTD